MGKQNTEGRGTKFSGGTKDAGKPGAVRDVANFSTIVQSYPALPRTMRLVCWREETGNEPYRAWDFSIFSAANSWQQTQGCSPQVLPTQYQDDAHPSLGQGKAIISIRTANSRLIDVFGINYLTVTEKKATALARASRRIQA